MTEFAGTTRDVISKDIYLDGILFHISDTAGIRETFDPIELIGIGRSKMQATQSDLVIFLILASELESSETKAEIEFIEASGIPYLIVVNKVDLLNDEQIQSLPENQLRISAQSGYGIEQLISKIKEKIHFNPESAVFLAKRRHIESLKSARDYIQLAYQELKEHQSYELSAENLRIAQEFLASITGSFRADDLLGEIFSKFCIGK